MKSTLRFVSIVLAVAFAIAAFAQFAGLFTIPGAPTAALFGALVVCCVVAFALGDYARKPAFRVRRTSEPSADAGYTVNRPAGSPPDWTYTTRHK